MQCWKVTYDGWAGGLDPWCVPQMHSKKWEFSQGKNGEAARNKKGQSQDIVWILHTHLRGDTCRCWSEYYC